MSKNFLGDLLDRLIGFSRNLYEAVADRLYRIGLRLGPVLRQLFETMLGYSGDHWKRVIVFGGLAVTVFITGFTGIVFGIYLADRSEIVNELDQYKDWLQGRGKREKIPPIHFYSVNGSHIGEYLPHRDSRMTLNTCGKLEWLKRAAVSAEDREFYEHSGVSFRGILRAFVNNLTSLSLREGGGTITQQLGRNLFTDRARSFTRKLYETFVAFLIEDRFSKDEILCLYLNKIYMGKGRIGAEEAAWYYFKKPPQALTAAEAAMIVGLFPSPVHYSPQNNIHLSLKKQRLVMITLQRDEYLTEKEKNIGIQKFLKIYNVTEGPDGDAGKIGLYGASRDFRKNLAPTANDYIKEVLYEKIPEAEIEAGGLKVFTTIDLKRQRAALDAIRRKIAAIRTKLLTNQKVPREEMERIARRMNGVFIALDSQTGDIRAVVGGYAIREGNMTFRVRRMQRQPGSSIKGALYATAFDEGVLSINDLVVDERINIGGYRPRNWNHKYLGPVPLRKALGMSINTVAVKTLDDVGVSAFRDRLIGALDLSYGDSRKRFPANLSLALGSGEVSPLELARIYATIENGGRVVYPRLVTRIENQNGEVIWQDYGRPEDGEVVLSEDACAQTVRLMESVFDPEVEGTVSYVGKSRAKNPAYLPFPIAGKTGTVQSVAANYKKFPGMRGAHDAWFVGLTPGEAAVVWLGHDEGAPFPGGGSGTAAPVWVEYAQRALKGRVPEQWSESVREIEIEDPEIEEPEPEQDPESELESDPEAGPDAGQDSDPEPETGPKPENTAGPETTETSVPETTAEGASTDSGSIPTDTTKPATEPTAEPAPGPEPENGPVSDNSESLLKPATQNNNRLEFSSNST